MLEGIACPSCGGNQVRLARWPITSWLRWQLACRGKLVHNPILEVVYVCRQCKARWSLPWIQRRRVVGYHGCRSDFAKALASGDVPVKHWQKSDNEYDWLGQGVYFWEHAPGRAWEWAGEWHGANGAVVAAEIELGRCLDLGGTEFTSLLGDAFATVKAAFDAKGLDLPTNQGMNFKLRKLDRLILDHFMQALDNQSETEGHLTYQTIRCPFEEGPQVYPGSCIRTQSHVQICVRDLDCIAPRVYLIPKGGES